MAEKKRKSCTNKGCAMHGIEVKVDAEKCVACGRPLETDKLTDLLDKFGMGDIFG